MRTFFVILIALVTLIACETPFFSSKDDFITHFEKSDGKQTTSYKEMMHFYKDLASKYTSISLKTMPKPDVGEPLNLVIYNSDGTFNFNNIREDKIIIMIANGMYQEQSEGIDATMLLMRNLAQKQIKIPENVVVVAIPTLHPQSEFLTEGIEQEYDVLASSLTKIDLDKDFIKNESQISWLFNEVFHLVRPNVFIDTRSVPQYNERNTIFYQTIIPERMTSMQNYLLDNFIPRLADSLSVKENEISLDSIPTYNQLFLPYPSTLFSSQSPSTSIGYTSLWHTLSLYIASQYNDSYRSRVEGMYNALKMIISVCNSDAEMIKELQKLQKENWALQNEYVFSYIPDNESIHEEIITDYITDNVVKDSSFNINLQKKIIKYPSKYQADVCVDVPKAYIIPKTLENIINRLKSNQIQMKTFDKDTILTASVYQIDDYKTLTNPYQSHYKHFQTEVIKKTQKIAFQKGDYFIETNQIGGAYLLETLEPSASESFFNWNFLDVIISENELDYRKFFMNDSLSKIPIYPIFRIEEFKN